MRVIGLFFFVWGAAAEGASRRCERIASPLCQNLGYNTTLMPNLVGHEDQREAILGLQAYGGLLRHNCSTFLRLFVCSVFIPLCSEDVPVAVPACRGLCEQVKSDCAAALNKAGLNWPHQLNCTRFPEPPNLCMQQPAEETPPVPIGFQQNQQRVRTVARICPAGTLAGLAGKCTECGPDEDDKTKLVSKVWTLSLSVFSLVLTMFVILTFAAQPKRFRWPARPVLYLSVCGFTRAALFLTRWIAALHICTGNVVPCTAFALSSVYVDLSTTIWWTLFSLVWYLSAAKEWSTESIERLSTRLHSLTWIASAAPVITTLIVHDAFDLNRSCQITSRILTIIQLILVTLGFILAGFTSVALNGVRAALLSEGRSPLKLERLIVRLRVVSVTVCVCLYISLLCYFFESNFAVMLKATCQLLVGVFASLWVFSSKTFKSWNKILWTKRTPSSKV